MLLPGLSSSLCSVGDHGGGGSIRGSDGDQHHHHHGEKGGKRRATQLLARALPIRGRSTSAAGASSPAKSSKPSSTTTTLPSEMEPGCTWTVEITEEEFIPDGVAAIPLAPSSSHDAASRLFRAIHALDAAAVCMDADGDERAVSVRDLHGLLKFLDDETDSGGQDNAMEEWPPSVRVLAFDAVTKAMSLLGGHSADPSEGYPIDEDIDVVAEAVKRDVGLTSRGDLVIAAVRCFAQLPPRAVWKLLGDANFATELRQVVEDHSSVVTQVGLARLLPHLLLRCWLRAQSPLCPETGEDIEDRIADIFGTIVLHYQSPVESLSGAAFAALCLALDHAAFCDTDAYAVEYAILPHGDNETSATRKLVERLHRRIAPHAEGIIARARFLSLRNSPVAPCACAAARLCTCVPQCKVGRTPRDPSSAHGRC